MSRLSFLVRHPGRTLSTIGVIAAAAGLTIGSGANFTASTANAASVFTAGSLSLQDTANGTANAAVFTVTGAVPGTAQTGLVAIKNTGTIAGTLAISDALTSNFPAADLTLVINQCQSFTTTTPTTCDGTPTQVYTGGLAGASIPATSLAAGSGYMYQFIVTLSPTAANTDQGDSASAVFTWTATSA